MSNDMLVKQADIAIAELTIEFRHVEERCKALLIKTDEDVQYATESIVLIKQLLTRLEEKRKSIVEEPTRTIRAINARFKLGTDKLETMRDKIEIELRRYREEQRKAAEEAERKRLEWLRKEEERQRKALAEGKAATTRALPQKLRNAPQEPPKTLVATSGTVSRRLIVRWKVVDEAAIPRVFLTVDEKKLNLLARETDPNGELPQVPGVSFYTEESFTVKG